MKSILLIGISALVLSSPAMAAEAAAEAATPAAAASDDARNAKPAEAAPAKKTFSTGVAKGRDLLDSAISASSLDDDTMQKLSARSLADVLRNIPGIRTEGSTGDGASNYTIRGLPLTSGGSKFMQLQEDGLPVIEFGDFFNVGSDIFIRADFNVGQIEAIRGGSASTFSSNSPGGVINLISKTGDEEGGAIQATSGVNYDEKRLDFDYGGKLSDTLRFHVGGFYRSGEGVRRVGFTGVNGGQLKFNITKTLPTGYIRFNAKYLDDRSPIYQPAPFKITGTADKPVIENVANFDIRRDTLISHNINTFIGLDANNQPLRDDMEEGVHAQVKSVGLEAQFGLGEWTITERGRFSGITGRSMRDFPSTIYAASALPASLGAGTGTFTYANGPNKGQVIASPTTLNGNGLIANDLLNDVHINALDNFTNDLRANRTWKIGGGDFTLTGGIYKSYQKLNTDWFYANILQEVLGGGKAALLDFTDASGVKQTQAGVLNYSLTAGTGLYRRNYDLSYDITAPFGSVNYHIGKLAIGGSIRYDIGSVNGRLFGSDLGGGRVGSGSYDFNNDGVISVAESKTAFLPLTTPAPVNYDYHYLSYSVGVNYRIAEPLSVFARYSRGARANADKILFATVGGGVSTTSGLLGNSDSASDLVRQLEGGFKFRKSDVALNVTGFYAKTEDTNIQTGGINTERLYRSYGAEVEATYQHGPFSVIASMTYTKAKILSDSQNAAVADKTPRRQPEFIFSATPQYQSRYFSVGANVIANTGSYANDTNTLKMPGYTIVGAFLQVRPIERVQLMVNVNNLFNTMAFYEIAQASIPTNGVGWGRAFNGRTISGSLRLSF